ncbi:MAG: M1 family metallopeptidase [Myxococcaceae bacterium]
MARLDPHSYNDDSQPKVTSFDWKARVDFDKRVIDATIELQLERGADGPLDLDTRGLVISEVIDGQGRPLKWELADADPILGQRLRLGLKGGDRLRIRYRTSPDASALQWLNKDQTAGKKQPYVFTQCQAIHARSVIPIQDTPRVRVKFKAEISAPSELRSVMAAAPGERSVNGSAASETFEMPQPIPPYLFAFAVGELQSRELGPRSRVWAEPSIVEGAAWEFEAVDKMILAAEALFGPYDWDRFDILTMPPSFPYGGMENPRLTFLTPSLLAKDRSLVNVLAHELAHSWTGNLVTNSNAEHFWLNEGFTVYAERRILEALEGREESELHAALGRRALEQAVQQFSDHPELTKLCTHLQGVDPDEAFSQVPYEKGYLLLRALEEQVGRSKFDAFIKKYMATYRFQSITTEDFVGFVEKELPGALQKVHADEYLNGSGIPTSAPLAKSSKLEAVRRIGTEVPSKDAVAGWGATEWQLYLESLPDGYAHARELDERFGLNASKNYEVLVSWLSVAAMAKHAPALPQVERVLGEIGRMKYLRPLYKALIASGETQRARKLFDKFRNGYHPIAAQVIEAMLKKANA